LGQSGALSGFLLFTKINCTLAQFGQTQLDAPPEHPLFPDLAAQNLVITNTSGVIALRLTFILEPDPLDRSAHRHEADAFAFVVAGDALGVGVDGQDAVHQEGIAMVAMLQFNHEQPGTVRHLFHWMGGRVPLVEVADQAHGFGL
jgi:hypothetical protein